MRLFLPSVWLIVGLTALLTVGLPSASAEEESDQPETFVTRLYPGHNLVGWTTQSAPVNALFEAVPEIELVYAWDATKQRWRFAAPTIRERFWSLRTLTPGMGLQVRVTGVESIDWERPRRPAQGTVQLEVGWNMVSWLGRDGSPLDRAISGVGRQFKRARLWSEQDQAFLHYRADTIANREAQPSLAFGDALWVEVGRSVNWLQPTGVVPEVVFAGHADASLQNRVIADVRAVIDFHWDQYGIEADFSQFIIYVARSPEHLNRALGGRSLLSAEARLLQDTYRLAHIRDIWSVAAGWADEGARDGHIHMAIKQEHWSKSQLQERWSPRSNTAHEYLHILQYHLVDHRARFKRATPTFHEPPRWITEGWAMWIQDALEYASEGSTWEQIHNRAREQTIGLPSLEEGGDSFEYVLGRAAAHLLTESPSDYSLLEYFRTLKAQGLGPHGQWESWPRWQDAFNDVFGRSIGEFYREFESWRGTNGQAGSQTHEHPATAPSLAGYVVLAEGADPDVTKVKIRVRTRTEDGLEYSIGGKHWMNAGEGFELAVEPNSRNLLSVQFGEPSCVAYYAEGEAVQDPDDADVLQVESSSIRNLELKVSSRTCSERVHGTLLDATGHPLAGLVVSVQRPLDYHTNRDNQNPTAAQFSNVNLSNSDGSFSLLLARSMHGTLTIRLRDECQLSIPLSTVDRVGRSEGVWHGSRGTIASTEDGAVVDVQIRVEDDACGYAIAGRVVDADGSPVAGEQVAALSEGGASARGRTNSDGSFAMVVPENGQYRVSVRIDGCRVFYRDSGATLSHQQASLVRVSDANATGVKVQLAEGVCGRRISGRLLNADGTPRGGVAVAAHGNAGLARDSTDSDGAFSVAVPASGSYLLSVFIDGCNLHYSGSGPTTNLNNANEIHVSNAQVTGIEFRLPENPAAFCN
ncbi:MAG: carboxypeptidase regulatory-like domain-containing protein [Chloroflexi bacterium]|nr:carboxypeptidase regulatory-like domain-containing protein [Chloroflexota bacterium]